MTKKLAHYGFDQISEGSIYPILLRMQKEQLVTTVTKASASGPKRKYYTLTQAGEQALTEFIDRWNELQKKCKPLITKREVRLWYQKKQDTFY
ncbi:hypothetical protein BsIDN1_23380 [Bacillus safensis]|uniref:Transcription regulator PadR N-terminal domain-containing protein n=1 Tax=Bacillus safensis TaxID=561879 RepID=A0A5S9M545_BACIA|nr:hypothetical protein BsIDN1_23380 [Bacillus safensis]